MKNFISYLWTQMLQSSGVRRLAFLTLLIWLLALALPARADNQGYPSTFLSLTNVPTVMTNGQVSAATNNYVPLRANSGLGLQAIFGGSNLVTAPFTLYCYLSVDGTNAFTTPFATLPLPSTGTNVVIGGTNWSQLTLRGYAGVFIAVSNGTGANVLTGGTFTNAAGIVFPLGLLANRPNQ